MEFYCDEAIAVATLNKLELLVVVTAGHFYVHTESHNYVICQLWKIECACIAINVKKSNLIHYLLWQ